MHDQYATHGVYIEETGAEQLHDFEVGPLRYMPQQKNTDSEEKEQSELFF